MKSMKSILPFAVIILATTPTISSGQGKTFEGKLKQIPTDKIEKKIDDKVGEMQREVDANEDAKKIANSILNPIYQLAEKMSFAGFYWIAFALMFAGVINFALQIAVGKLYMLAKFHFSLIEILSDALGLLMSLVGLVLTTQAATENSTFTQSAFSVLSAAALGGFVGFILFLQGTKQEAAAAEAGQPRRRRSRSRSRRDYRD